MAASKTFADIRAEEALPAVAIDQNSMFTWVNQAFEREYGWTEDELLGKSVTEIIPPYLRDAHLVGFSRFMSTGKATLLGRALSLSVLYKDSSVRDAEHFIVGERQRNQWHFASTIVPRR